MPSLSSIIFYIPSGTSITPSYGIYRLSDQKYLDFATLGTTPAFSTAPTTISATLVNQSVGTGGSLGKWIPTTPLVVSGSLLAAITDGNYIYELFDSSQSPAVISAYSSPISAYISSGSDQIAPSGAAPTAAAIATSVWSDLIAGSDFSVPNSIGNILKTYSDIILGSGSVIGSPSTSSIVLSSSNMGTVSGLYTGRRLYVTLAAGGFLMTNPAIHTYSGGNHTFTFAIQNSGVPASGDVAEVVGF